MKSGLLTLGIFAILASLGMYVVGSNSTHISELKDFFWVPLPLAVLLIAAAFGKQS